MDDIVKQAMAKWPQVPDCYGWLGLDARGNWYLRDERAQAQGAFASGLPGSGSWADAEQASAALDALTDAERSAFQTLNSAYTAKHGFPFIIAVRDNSKDSILAAFQTRIGNDTETEFTTACAQVERIAELRLKAILP